jgi:CheY-like chemotaxis protein
MARILVIDDDAGFRTMASTALRSSGHTVETASDGDKGLDRFGDGAAWDLVLLGQRLAGLEGITVLKQIRYYNPLARVIMITAHATVALAVEAMKSGAADFLCKPISAEALRCVVETTLKDACGGSASGNCHCVTFAMTTMNGFRIECPPEAGMRIGADVGFRFSVRSPTHVQKDCTVVLSAVVIELIKAHVDRDSLPGGARFWQSLCEEALANYIYQHAGIPEDGLLRVDDFTTSLQRYVDTILPVLG